MSDFILSHVDIQLSQYHLKKTSHSSLNCFGTHVETFDRKCEDFLLDSQFNSTEYPYASTILS